MARITSEQKEKTRATVFEAARIEFESHGFEAASLRAIAERAGVATGTLFNYADGKLGLLHTIFYGDLQKLVELVPSISRNSSLIEQIVEIFGLFLDHYSLRPELSRVFLKESLFGIASSSADFRKQAQSVAGEIEQRVRDLSPCTNSKTHARPPLVVLTAVSAYYFSLIHGFSQGKPQPVEQRHLIRIQLEQLLGKI